MKRKKVTMADLAAELGVSKNAVSLAMSGKSGVSEALRARILETAVRLNYASPAEPINNRRLCIVVIVPDYIRDDSYFYSDVFWSIEHETRKIGYTPLTAGLSARAEQECETPIAPDELEVLGYLAIGIIREEYMRALQALGKPVLSVDIHHNNVAIPSVGSDNIRGGFLAANHLIACGHKSLGFAGPIYAAQSVYERWCGFQQALMMADLPIRDEFLLFGARDRFELLDNAETLSAYLNNLRELPSAWFCAGDLIAIALISLLSARGIRVPDDVSVIGFDNLQVTQMVNPHLTTVHVDRKKMGRLAVWQLIDLTRKGRPSGCIRMELSCELVVRQSVRSLTE